MSYPTGKWVKSCSKVGDLAYFGIKNDQKSRWISMISLLSAMVSTGFKRTFCEPPETSEWCHNIVQSQIQILQILFFTHWCQNRISWDQKVGYIEKINFRFSHAEANFLIPRNPALGADRGILQVVKVMFGVEQYQEIIQRSSESHSTSPRYW